MSLVHSIDKTPVTVSWTESATVVIGRHGCSWCGKLSPTPSTEFIIDWIKEHPTVSTLWPFDYSPGGLVFHPPGWMRQGADELCDECAPVFERACSTAREARMRRPSRSGTHLPPKHRKSGTPR